MILTRYSEQALQAHKYVKTVNDALAASKWRKKFAWKKTQVTVPGVDNEAVINLAWLRFYYTRNIYSVAKVSGMPEVFGLKHSHTVNILSMDALTYFAVGEDDEPDEVTLRQTLIKPVRHALRTQEVFFVRGWYDRSYTSSFRDSYISNYELIKGTELAEGMLTPEALHGISIKAK